MDKTKIDALLKVNLLEELGLNDIAPEEKMSIIQDAVAVVTRGAWIKAFGKLSKEKQNELGVMLESDTPEDAVKVMEFIKNEVLDFEDILKGEIARYKDILLSK